MYIREKIKDYYYYMVYAIQVWGSACISEINRILVLQKRALRIITQRYFSISATTFARN